VCLVPDACLIACTHDVRLVEESSTEQH